MAYQGRAVCLNQPPMVHNERVARAVKQILPIILTREMLGVEGAKTTKSVEHGSDPGRISR